MLGRGTWRNLVDCVLDAAGGAVGGRVPRVLYVGVVLVDSSGCRQFQLWTVLVADSSSFGQFRLRTVPAADSSGCGQFRLQTVPAPDKT